MKKPRRIHYPLTMPRYDEDAKDSEDLELEKGDNYREEKLEGR